MLKLHRAVYFHIYRQPTGRYLQPSLVVFLLITNAVFSFTSCECMCCTLNMSRARRCTKVCLISRQSRLTVIAVRIQHGSMFECSLSTVSPVGAADKTDFFCQSCLLHHHCWRLCNEWLSRLVENHQQGISTAANIGLSWQITVNAVTG